MPLNPFVYEACLEKGVRFPDIPVLAPECYGQCGEDLIVQALLEATAFRLGVDLKKTACVEIGGNHPFATSATYLLSKRFGLASIIVEANEALLGALKKGRPDDVIVHGAVQDKDVERVMFSTSKLSELSSLDRSFVLGWDKGRVGEASWTEVPALRINDVLRKFVKARAISYLSVDAEGLDLVILKDMDFGAWRPWLVQAEPSEAQVRGNTQNITAFMGTVGYRLAARTDVNLIFADQRI